MSGRTPARAGGSDHRDRVLITVKNCAAAADHRVAKQIGSLVEVGYQVRVITPGGPENAVYRGYLWTRVFAYPPPPQPRGRLGYLVEYAYSVLTGTSDESLTRGHAYLCCWMGVLGLQGRADLVLCSIDQPAQSRSSATTSSLP
jgi:hypothetical protein